jgi:hypothetical protein
MRMLAFTADVVLWPCAPKARIIIGGRFHPEIYGPAVRCKRNVSNGRYGPRHDEQPHRRSVNKRLTKDEAHRPTLTIASSARSTAAPSATAATRRRSAATRTAR